MYRRLEARGEIRGGRFISGVAGEQFSMSESIRQLRLLRDAEQTNEFCTDLGGRSVEFGRILDDQPRVPSIASHRLVYLNGRCAGTMIAEEKWLSTTLNDDARTIVADLLEREDGRKLGRQAEGGGRFRTPDVGRAASCPSDTHGLDTWRS